MCQSANNRMKQSAVLKSLSILLGLFFIFVGTLKITSAVSKELHKDLRKQYVKYAKVFPLAELFKIKIPSKWYRRTIGLSEIIFGMALAFYPNYDIKNIANFGLLVLTLIAVYSHYMIADTFEKMATALVFVLLLGGRLAIVFQLRKKDGEKQTNVNGLKVE